MVQNMALPKVAHSNTYSDLLLSLLEYFLFNSQKTTKFWGRPHGPMVKFVCSPSAAQGFAGSDPGRVQGTAHQAMLRRWPTQHSQKDLQLEYTTMYWGSLGRRRREKKRRLATDVSSGANPLKRKNLVRNNKQRWREPCLLSRVCEKRHRVFPSPR